MPAVLRYWSSRSSGAGPTLSAAYASPIRRGRLRGSGCSISVIAGTQPTRSPGSLTCGSLLHRSHAVLQPFIALREENSETASFRRPPRGGVSRRRVAVRACRRAPSSPPLHSEPEHREHPSSSPNDVTLTSPQYYH